MNFHHCFGSREDAECIVYPSNKWVSNCLHQTALLQGFCVFQSGHICTSFKCTLNEEIYLWSSTLPNLLCQENFRDCQELEKMSLQWALGAGVPELPCLWRPWVSLRSGAICYIVILWGWWNHSVWAVISHWDIGVGILNTSPLHLLPLGRFGRASGGGTALPRRILQRREEKVWYFVHKYLILSH